MIHAMICREYAPSPGGGIGTYGLAMARLLAEAGETVHVIAMAWDGAMGPVEESHSGRLIVHRVPFIDPGAGSGGGGAWTLLPEASRHEEVRGLAAGPAPGLAFGWLAAPMLERLAVEEGLDVIEAPEFEAPGYFVQLRRALGLGPARRPPVLVHVHSPTECIDAANGAPPPPPYRTAGPRQEEYSIHAADALICPSHAQAVWTRRRHGLADDRIEIIRLPLPAGTPAVAPARSPVVWAGGPIHVSGRLAPGKGVLELASAIAMVAGEFPSARFEFAGGDVPQFAGDHGTMRRAMLARVPEAFHDRLTFLGHLSTAHVAAARARARMAVVASRFENFPYVCAEAMADGLPVLAAPKGGMAEMIVDGETGWISAAQNPGGLAEALRRALSAPPEELRRLGAAGSERIRAMCDGGEIVARHMELRERLVARGASRSISLPPAALPVSSRPGISLTHSIKPSTVADSTLGGIAIIVACYNLGAYLDECVASVKAQTVAPLATLIVDDGSTDPATRAALDRLAADGWRVMRQPNAGVVAARNNGAAAVRAAGHRPAGFVFLDADDTLRPRHVEVMSAVLAAAPDCGLASCYVRHFEAADLVWTEPCPAFPAQWMANSAATFSVYRAEAFDAAGGYRELMDGCYSDWDLNNAVMAAGWKAVTVPEVLAGYRVRSGSMLRSATARAHATMLRDLLERFPAEVARDAVDLVMMAEGENFELRRRLDRLRHLASHPWQALRFVAPRAVAAFRKVLAR